MHTGEEAGLAASARAWEDAEAWAVAAAEVVAGGVPGLRNPTSMARKFWSGSPRKPAAATLRFRASIPSSRSTHALRRSFETSTAWATRRTERTPRVHSARL